ncbi:sporulation histidine kinase inhibitor Sda [Alkalihalophilus marmarensis]|uniref:Sporulation inhibitor A n=1 Tax=Alkalihalophilus marmarensis DSM 21297 TaxID=1188261 RepID=U6SU53_9BACI|nr:sporulation histidine kinase inhibitor Sda [Alkalihalophilus marmarensis]ERN54420.1 hypothetical protein A33I_08345 [Alkalihalophilus marmarensis DSM 21297]
MFNNEEYSRRFFENFSDDFLLEAHHMSLKKGLDHTFISLIEEELEIRGIYKEDLK